MKKRLDGKKTNLRIDAETVSAIKALGNTVPAKLLACVFDVYLTSVYLYVYEQRRADVQPMDIDKARRMLTKKFNQMVGMS